MNIKEACTENLTLEETDLIDNFRLLNTQGKEKVVEYSCDLMATKFYNEKIISLEWLKKKNK